MPSEVSTETDEDHHFPAPFRSASVRRHGRSTRTLGLIDMRTSVFAIAALCSSLSIAQGVSNTPQADQQANAAARLFMDACAANLGDEPKLKGWIRENRLRPTDPGFSQKVLQGQPGEVWSATSQVGDFLVVVGSPYRCAVWARRADAPLAVEHFQRLIKGVERPGLSVNLAKDQEFQGQGGKYRQVAYILKKQGATAGWAMLATVSESPTAEVQVRFTVSAAK